MLQPAGQVPEESKLHLKKTNVIIEETRNLLVVLLDVVKDEVEGLGFLTIGGDGNNRGGDGLSGLSALLEAGKASPVTEGSALRDVDKGGVGGAGESLNETLVRLLVAILSQDHQTGLTALQSLDSLADTTSKTIVGQGLLQDDLQRAQDVELLLLLHNLNRGSNFSVSSNHL